MPAASPLTTLTVITLRPDRRRWGLAQMGLLPRQFAQVPGLRFAKLLGSGFDFGLRPNLRRYGLMAVWDNEAAADMFFAGNASWQQFRQHSTELWTARLQPLQAHGLWDGSNPFDYAVPEAPTQPDGPVAVLTRASIRPLRSWSFWKAVPPVSRAVVQAPGYVAGIGLGELPFIRQATFSVWESAAQMRQYAYGHQHDGRHKDVVKRTRQEKWYSEELFARFRVLRAEGSWDGQNPLNRPERA
ncbi:spheroidene monooxygenase [Hymenobacter koreensis]|uniref:Spheroidene monooxygenase n=1 Tax=Hymenobacter koreensis TaxID=1084523 RepID=A0ABP8J6G3_9BACT